MLTCSDLQFDVSVLYYVLEVEEGALQVSKLSRNCEKIP